MKLTSNQRLGAMLVLALLALAAICLAVRQSGPSVAISPQTRPDTITLAPTPQPEAKPKPAPKPKPATPASPPRHHLDETF